MIPINAVKFYAEAPPKTEILTDFQAILDVENRAEEDIVDSKSSLASIQKGAKNVLNAANGNKEVAKTVIRQSIKDLSDDYEYLSKRVNGHTYNGIKKEDLHRYGVPTELMATYDLMNADTDKINAANKLLYQINHTK